MATTAFQPILGKQVLMGAQIGFKPDYDPTHIINLGAMATFTFNPEATMVDSFTSENGYRQKIGSWPVAKDGTFEIVSESFLEEIYEILFMSDKKYLTQTAVTNGEFQLTNVKVGKTFEIDGVNPSVTSLTNGDVSDPIELEEDVHFTMHQSGIGQIIEVPEGFGTTAGGTYSLPEITEADKLLDMGIMSNAGVSGQLIVLGVVADGMPGVETEQRYWKVKLLPNGPINALNTEALAQASIRGTVEAVNGKPKGQQYGRQRSFSKI